jgi:hypothetical protein
MVGRAAQFYKIFKKSKKALEVGEGQVKSMLDSKESKCECYQLYVKPMNVNQIEEDNSPNNL